MKQAFGDALPAALGRLTALHTLRLEHSQLSALPAAMAHLPLRSLHLQHNTLCASGAWGPLLCALEAYRQQPDGAHSALAQNLAHLDLRSNGLSPKAPARPDGR